MDENLNNECCDVTEDNAECDAETLKPKEILASPDVTIEIVCNSDAAIAEDAVENEEVLPEPTYPHMDIEDMLKVPGTVLFPMELSRYLKDKLTAVAEQNWHLVKHSKSQEAELNDLSKLRDTSKDPAAQMRKESPTVLSGKIIDLSKKNRDMTTQVETMRVKMQQLMAENEAMKKKVYTNTTPPPSLNGSGDAVSLDGSVLGTSRTGFSDVSSVSQQLTKTTTKMMEYRKQNQMLQMELRTALRALCQEVGEGTTVKSVLKEVAGPESTWRGRQQQIITLTQKVSDLQLKVAQAQHNASMMPQEVSSVAEEDDEQGLHVFHIPNGSGDVGAGGDNIYRSNIPVLVNASAKRQVPMLQNCEKKKQNQIEKLSQELLAVRTELKSAQLEAKGSKARTLFLESQVRSLRVDLDEGAIKIQSKQESLQQALEELRELRQELYAIREREKKHRENTNTEIHEANQALARERGVVLRLQKLISEKQDHLQKLDSKVARLQEDIQLNSSSSTSTVEYNEKIKSLENQLQLATQSIHTAEKERERLLTLISNSVGEAQHERQSHNEAERLLSRAFGILSLTDSCINRCLDAGQVTSKTIMEEVEEIRALVRELKAGTNYSIDFGEHCKIIPQQSHSTPIMSFGVKSQNKLDTSSGKEFETGSKTKGRFLPTITSRQQLNTRK